MFALIGARGFSAFPILPAEMTSDRGLFMLRDDSTYVVDRNGTVSSADDYSLAPTGQFSVLVDRGARLSKIRFSGAYGLEKKSDVYYFVDRYTSTTSNFIGMFVGVRVLPGTQQVNDEWHLFSLHVIYASSTVLDPNNVARAAGGRVKIDTADMVTGTALESTKATLTLSGTVNIFTDGKMDMTLDYKDPTGSDDRVFNCGVHGSFLFGLDEDQSDGESGLVAMMRTRKSAADLTEFAGDYIVGLQTAFVSPTKPGLDAAYGTLTFNATDGFSLNATGADGLPFSYSGKYSLADDGTLTLSVSGTNETWMGAVDEKYRVVQIIDNVIENRTSGKPPELNLILGLRESPDPSNP